MIISIDAEEAFYKTQCPFMINILSKLGRKGNFFNLIKDIYEKPRANSIHDKRLNIVPVRPGTNQGCLFLPILFNIILKVLARALMQEKDIKSM